MRFFTQHLRLLLIIGVALSPLQHLFAMPSAMQMDDSSVAATQNDAPTMPAEDCSEHDSSSNCQDSSQCGNCPLSLGMTPMTAKHTEPNTQARLTSPDISLYSTDLLPDYRPPRIS